MSFKGAPPVAVVAAGTGVAIGGTATAPTVSTVYGTAVGTAAQGNDGRFTSIASSTQAAGYTLGLADIATVVEGTNAVAQTFTIPPHATTAFPVGSWIEVFQDGAGQITIAAGVGVTLRSDAAKVKTAAQYATIQLRQRAQDEWVLSGDLA